MSNKVSIEVEPFSQCIEEMLPLLTEYWIEADERRHEQSMDLDLDTYFKADRIGAVHAVVCRSLGEMVGFVVFLSSPCSHTKKTKAMTEVSYVKPGFRNKGVGTLMLQYANTALPVDYLFITLKTELPHNNMAQEAGFRHVENVYMKEVVR